MNRIRKYKNYWQVLYTPCWIYSPSFEILRGFWDDDKLRNYYIREFETLSDAQCEAFKMPDIEWIRMVVMHKDAFHDLKDIIKKIIYGNNYIVDFEATFMDPDMAKESMFNRVMNNGRRFTLVNNMNDIISYHIVNPWSKNVNEIANVLQNDSRLRIIKRFTNNGVIHLVGKTEIGTTYEIGIWPTLLSQWAKWVRDNPNVNIEVKRDTLNKSLEMQKKLDSEYALR